MLKNRGDNNKKEFRAFEDIDHCTRSKPELGVRFAKVDRGMLMRSSASPAYFQSEAQDRREKDKKVLSNSQKDLAGSMQITPFQGG